MSARAITKTFGGVVALHEVSLDLLPGEVHCLIGENGAGKSTLGRIFGGATRPDAGELYLNGERQASGSPRAALRNGVCYIPQELSIVPARSVLSNVFLGSEMSRGGVMLRRYMRRRFGELVRATGFELDADVMAGSLRLADQQKVEILRALARRADVLVLDEPTAALGAQDSARLLDVIRGLRESGVTVVFVTHFLDEALAVADRITILKDGRCVLTTAPSGQTKESLLEYMLGQPLASLYPPRSGTRGATVLEATGLSRPGEFTDVSLSVRAGEIVGIAGLAGAGRTEFIRCLTGARQPKRGHLRLDGRSIRFRSVSQAIRSGVVMIPEERKTQGLFANRTVGQNVDVAHLPDYSLLGIVQRRRARLAVRQALIDATVRADRMDLPVMTLSGGNQQKVLFARWLVKQPRVLVADEPTRGVDMGARAAIYATLRRLADSGVAIVVVSSDNDEVLGIADRIVVMRGGSTVAEMDARTASEEDLLHAMMGVEAPRRHQPPGERIPDDEEAHR